MNDIQRWILTTALMVLAMILIARDHNDRGSLS